MTRSKQREQAFILVYESLFNGNDPEAPELFSENVETLGEYSVSLYNGVSGKAQELDEEISGILKGWKLTRLPKINLAILRIAVYEMKYVEDVPASVAINEAVELAKKYSGKEDASFINGILGGMTRGE